MSTRETTGPGLVSRIEAVALALILSVAIIGVTLLPITSAWYVRTLVRVVDSSALTGIGAEETERAAEAVRRFVTDSRAPALPARIAGRPAFDEAAVWHLVDVRDVIIPTRWLAIGLLAVAGAWSWLRWRGGHGRRFAVGLLRTTSGILATTVALAAAAGLADFDVLFSRFHALFFESGTWTFPYDALLIQVFPLPFWVAAGASWGVCVLAAAAVLWGLARRLRFTAGTYGV